MNFVSSKNEDFSISIVEVLCGKSPLRVKSSMFSKQKG